MQQTQPSPTIARFPTTSAQRRFWFQDQARPGDVETSIAVRWEIRGTFREVDIERAFQRIIDRHEILRTRFVEDDGEPVQEVLGRFEFRLGVVDLRAVPAEQHGVRVDAMARELAARPFDLSQPCQFRVTMVSLAANRAALLIVAHHIVFDGFSIGVLGNEFGTIMQALNERRLVPLDDLALQFGDYSLWEQELAGSEMLAADGLYWENRLADAEYFELARDFPRPAVHTAQGRTVTIDLGADFDARMTAFCKAQGVSSFTFGAAVMGAALQRWTGKTDVMFSVPVAGRTDIEVERLIGVFVNTLVIRMEVQPQTLFLDHLASLGPLIREALEHQAYPFDALVRRLRRPHHANRPHLVSLNLNLQRVFLAEQAYGDFQMISVPSHMPGIGFDMNLQIVGRDAGWKIMLDYNESLFTQSTAERFARLVQATFAFALATPQRPVVEIPCDTQGAQVPDAAQVVGTTIAAPDRTAPALAPRPETDGVEGALRTVWAEVLAIPATDCDGDFFELGGHSLQALRMIARVEKRFGFRTPLAGFLADPTLAGLTQTIARHIMALEVARETPPDRAIWTILPLREGPPDSPVIVTVNQPFLYRNVARAMTAPCTVVNLHVDNVDALARMADMAFDDIAREAAQTVRDRFGGRSLLGLGHCVDALVALRMCADLTAAGEKVILVGMMDAWAPGTSPEARTFRRRRRMHYLHQKLRGEISWKDLMLKNRVATQGLRRLGLAEDESPMEVLSRKVNHCLFALSRTTDLAPYTGEAMLFRTDGQTEQADDLRFGWIGTLPEDTPIYRVRGWHEDALLHGGFDRIARILDSKVARGARLAGAGVGGATMGGTIAVPQVVDSGLG